MDVDAIVGTAAPIRSSRHHGSAVAVAAIVGTAAPIRSSRHHGSAVAVAALLAVLVVAACGGGPSPSAPPFVTPGASSGSTFVVVSAAADEAGARDEADAFAARIRVLGGRAQALDARRDPRRAVLLVREALAGGARGIALAGADPAVGPAVARLAVEAGVPLLTTGTRMVDGSGAPVPFAGFDDVALGTAVGRLAADLLESRAWRARDVGVLVLEIRAVEACAARMDAAKEELLGAGVPAGQVLAVPYAGGQRSAADAALPVAAGAVILRRWVAIGCTDAGVAGALDALATARIPVADVIGVGLGGDLACRAWATRHDTGFRASIVVSARDVGAGAADLLWRAAVDGEPLPPVTLVPAPVIAPETFRTVLPADVVAACAASGRVRRATM